MADQLSADYLERLGKENDEEYFTSEDPKVEFLVHDELTHEIVDYLLEGGSEIKSDLVQAHNGSQSVINSELTSIEMSRWDLYTLDEGILEEKGSKDGTVTWGLDNNSYHTQTLLENTEL